MARFITFGDLEFLGRKLDGINRRLSEIKREDRDFTAIEQAVAAIRTDISSIKELQAMAVTKGDFDQLASDLNANTNKLATAQTAIAARIDRITALLQAGGMTEAEETAALASLRALVAPANAVADALTALGQDSTNPVPDVPPIEVPPVEGEDGGTGGGTGGDV